MRLKMLNHLQLVFQISQKKIGLEQFIILAEIQVIALQQSFQCPNGAAFLQLRIPATINQLKRLHKEFNLPDPPAPSLTCAPVILRDASWSQCDP